MNNNWPRFPKFPSDRQDLIYRKFKAMIQNGEKTTHIKKL